MIEGPARGAAPSVDEPLHECLGFQVEMEDDESHVELLFQRLSLRDRAGKAIEDRSLHAVRRGHPPKEHLQYQRIRD
jgi:hypothetical protein